MIDKAKITKAITEQKFELPTSESKEFEKATRDNKDIQELAAKFFLIVSTAPVDKQLATFLSAIQLAIWLGYRVHQRVIKSVIIMPPGA